MFGQYVLTYNTIAQGYQIKTRQRLGNFSCCFCFCVAEEQYRISVGVFHYLGHTGLVFFYFKLNKPECFSERVGDYTGP